MAKYETSRLLITDQNLKSMLGAITIGIAYLIAKALDDAGDYKEPK